MPGIYFQVNSIRGLIGETTCLACTEDGRLVSGGGDGVKVYNLIQEIEYKVPGGSAERGSTTALIWVQRDDEVEDGLVYGTEGGYLITWKEIHHKERKETTFEEMYCAQLARPSEITSLAFDAPSNYIAVCSRKQVVQLFGVDSNMKLRNVFSISLDDDIPQAVAFGQMGRDKRDILVFGLHNGGIYTLRGTDGQIQDRRLTGGMIGSATVHTKKDVFCIDDPTQGAALYRLQSGARVRTYKVKITKTMRVRQVVFAEDCSLIVIGSDHGKIYIFDRRSGEVVDQLETSTDGWVQTITSIDMAGIPTIIAAHSREDLGTSAIIVWQKGKNQHILNLKMNFYHTMEWIRHLLGLGMLIMSLAFIWQNFARGWTASEWGNPLGLAPNPATVVMKAEVIKLGEAAKLAKEIGMTGDHRAVNVVGLAKKVESENEVGLANSIRPVGEGKLTNEVVFARSAEDIEMVKMGNVVKEVGMLKAGEIIKYSDSRED